MSRDEAQALAARIRADTSGTVSLRPDGEEGSFVVEVSVASGTWTLYDEADWDAWRQQMAEK